MIFFDFWALWVTLQLLRKVSTSREKTQLWKGGFAKGGFPNLLFLAFLDFLAFFLSKEFLAFLRVFPFFPKDFRGSATIKNPPEKIHPK